MKLNTDILGDCRLVVMEVRGRLEQSSSKAVTWRSPGRSILTQRRWPPHPAFGHLLPRFRGRRDMRCVETWLGGSVTGRLTTTPTPGSRSGFRLCRGWMCRRSGGTTCRMTDCWAGRFRAGEVPGHRDRRRQDCTGRMVRRWA